MSHHYELPDRDPPPRASRLDVTQIERMIRTIEDPVELQRRLTEMIEEAHPVPAFTHGEVIPFYEFERRFKKAVCDGNETTFLQWNVEIFERPSGELCLSLGTSAAGKVRRGDGR